ncbi:MAG: Iron-regulated transporter permease protein SufD, partial [Bacteroidota bacterium]|nr:Iron-regulated transporter permease protein SufD [Bacteroidota bacterium]
MLEKNLNGQKEGFLHKLRKEALSSFQKLGIPGNRHEEWKYTHIKTKLPETLKIAGNTHAIADKFNSFPAIKATKLVFVNGIFNKDLSNIIEEKGVIVGSLKEHFSASKTIVEGHYNKLVNK